VIKNLQKLISENPELPVIAKVDGEIVMDDSFAWWLGSIGTAELGEYVIYDERFYDEKEHFLEVYYEHNDDEICELFGFEDAYTLSPENEKIVDDYIKKIADKIFVKAIFVSVDLPDDVVNEYEGNLDYLLKE
jgi:hypothetical protein